MVRPIGEVGGVAERRAIGSGGLLTRGKDLLCLDIDLQPYAREKAVHRANNRKRWTGVAFAAVTVVVLGSSYAQQGPRGGSSYAPVDITEPFSATLARLSAQKPATVTAANATPVQRFRLFALRTEVR
jgi:hypothetical protein